MLFPRSDNAPEFVSRGIVDWTRGSGISTTVIDPGKHWPTGTNESFAGNLPLVEWFRSRASPVSLSQLGAVTPPPEVRAPG
jgi:hypothetical protein